MPDEGKGKRLLAAAAAAGGAGATFGAVGALGRRAEEKHREAARQERVKVEAERAARQEQKAPAKRKVASKSPTSSMTPTQSKEFREYTQKKRLSARAQKARARMAKAGSKSLGTAGLALNAPEAIRTAEAVEKEGGPYAARFGKFVERILGVAPSRHLPRPPTEKERMIQY